MALEHEDAGAWIEEESCLLTEALILFEFQGGEVTSQGRLEGNVVHPDANHLRLDEVSCSRRRVHPDRIGTPEVSRLVIG
jgi:hypothetical protein